jgi:hypothetical protein
MIKTGRSPLNRRTLPSPKHHVDNRPPSPPNQHKTGKIPTNLQNRHMMWEGKKSYLKKKHWTGVFFGPMTIKLA